MSADGFGAVGAQGGQGGAQAQAFAGVPRAGPETEERAELGVDGLRAGEDEDEGHGAPFARSALHGPGERPGLARPNRPQQALEQRVHVRLRPRVMQAGAEAIHVLSRLRPALHSAPASASLRPAPLEVFSWYRLGAERPELVDVARQLLAVPPPPDAAPDADAERVARVRDCALLVRAFATVARDVAETVRTFLACLPPRARHVLSEVCYAPGPVYVVPLLPGEAAAMPVSMLTQKPILTRPVVVVCGSAARAVRFVVDEEDAPFCLALARYARCQETDPLAMERMRAQLRSVPGFRAQQQQRMLRN